MGPGAEVVLGKLRGEAEGKGLEVYPFKIGWYNARVKEPFVFPLHADTLAAIIVSSPSMFEKLFLPFLSERRCAHTAGKVDPLDTAIREEMERLAGSCLGPDAGCTETQVIQDSDLWPSRRPKVLVQTAGHVAGAAYYYQRSDVEPQPWDRESRIYGVSVHPKYGGWFALRGVLIFHGLLVPGLAHRDPVDCVRSRERRIELLEKFNFSWQDWGYRDVTDGQVMERYSDLQRTYFSTEPRDRFSLIEKWQEDKDQQTATRH